MLCCVLYVQSFVYVFVQLVYTSLFHMYVVTPCGDYYCFNGGVCKEDKDGMSYCACEDPYFGDYCLYQPERECPHHLSITRIFFIMSLVVRPFSTSACYCLNGGYGCDNLTDYNGTCTCPEEFTGSHCETEICEHLFLYISSQCLYSPVTVVV